MRCSEASVSKPKAGSMLLFATEKSWRGEFSERRRGIGAMRNIGWRVWTIAVVVMWHAPLFRRVFTWKHSATADLAVTATCSSRCPYSPSSSVRWPPTSLVSQGTFLLLVFRINDVLIRAVYGQERK